MPEQSSTTFINFTYSNSTISTPGDYSHQANVSIAPLTICSVALAPQRINIPGQPESSFTYDSTAQVVMTVTSIPLIPDASFELPTSQANSITPGTRTDEGTGNDGEDEGGSSGEGSGGGESAASPSLGHNVGLKVATLLIAVTVLGAIQRNPQTGMTVDMLGTGHHHEQAVKILAAEGFLLSSESARKWSLAAR